MRFTTPLLLMLVLIGLPVSTFAAAKESVTIEIDADLLKRARAQHLDLASFFEAQLQAKLGGSAKATPASRMALMTESFDNFEAMMFAPLKVNASTPTAEVRKVCQAMMERGEQLKAHAKARKAMPHPTSLEEAKKLDDYLASRFKSFQARAAKSGKQAQAATKIMKSKCADLDQNEKSIQVAMKEALAGYGPVGWCRAMMKKPKAQWNMEEAGKFAKFCPGVKPE